MKLSNLTLLIFEVNAALDSGKYQDITLKEVGHHIEGQDILEYLSQRLGRDFDIGLIDAATKSEIAKALDDVYGGIGPSRMRRKFGVENNGLCLMIGLITEVIQRLPAAEL